MSLRSRMRSVRAIFKRSVLVVRRHWVVLYGAALFVLIPASALEGLLEFVADRVDFAPALFITVASFTIGSLGYNLYKGIATAAAVEWRAGGTVSWRRVAAELPWWRLLVIEVILVVGTVIGALLFLIPGILFATFFALAPIVVELDRCTVRQALARSARLVRQRFWLVLVIQVLSIVLGGFLKDAVELLVGGGSGSATITLGYGDQSFASFVAGLVVKPLSALLLVELVFELRGPRAVAR